MDLFKEVIPSILQTKQYQIQTEDDEKSFDIFMTNRALSHHMDCVLYANEMNTNYHIDKKLQYDFLFHSIKKAKRPYQKWVKSTNIENLSLIKEYYGYSNEKAKDALRILKSEDIEYIISKLDKGGCDKKLNSKKP